MKSLLSLILLASLGILTISQQNDERYIEFTVEVFPEGEEPFYAATPGKVINFFNLNYQKNLDKEHIICYIDGEKQEAFTNEATFTEVGEHSVKYVFLTPLTDMSFIFYQDFEITKVEFNNMDTSLVEYAENAFNQCFNLKEIIGLDKMDWSHLRSADSMFSHCQSMETINIGNLIGPSVQNIGFLFMYCMKLKSIQWDNVDTSNVNYMYQTFSNCYELEKVDLSDWDMNAVFNFNEIFWDNRVCEVTLKNKEQYELIKSKYSQLDESVKTIHFKEE